MAVSVQALATFHFILMDVVTEKDEKRRLGLRHVFVSTLGNCLHPWQLSPSSAIVPTLGNCPHPRQSSPLSAIFHL